MSKNQISSRRNGLVIAIPASGITHNLMQRFALKGDNELVFAQAVTPTKATFESSELAPDDATPPPQGADALL